MQIVHRKLPTVSRFTLWVGLFISLWALRSEAQTQVFCHVTEVKAERLLNAVRINIHSDDGVLDIPMSYPDVRQFIQWERGFEILPVDRLRFFISNARSKMGNFVDVGIYPVSHVELSVPPGAAEGVGLNVEVVLYTPARLRQLELGDWELGPWGEIWGVQFDVRQNREKTSLILTIKSDRLIEAPAEEDFAQRLQEARQEYRVTHADGLLSLYALNTDLRQLFQALATETGTRIVVDQDVEHLASVNLIDRPVDEVIRALAQAYGLAVMRQDEMYLVGEATARGPVAFNLGVTEPLPLQYLSASQALQLLPDVVLRYVHVDSQHNTLVASGPPAVIDKIRRDLQQVDLPSPQIAIEVQAVQVEDDQAFEQALNLLAPPTAAPALQLPRKWSFDVASGLLSYVQTANVTKDLVTQWKALEEQHRVSLRAQTRVTVINGETARILVGGQKFIQVLRLESGRWLQVDMQEVDVGITFEITPWTGGGGTITSHILAELNDIIATDPSGMPTLSTRRVDANVRTRDGETVVLGGQVLDHRTRVKRYIPLLADLPLLGELFRGREVVRRKSRLLFFITPRVIAADVGQAVRLPLFEEGVERSENP